MRLHEAIDAAMADDSLWFRPVSMRGMGTAYCIKGDGYLYHVPSASGGLLGAPARASSLRGEWEVLTPDDVIAERNRYWSEPE